MKKIHLFGSIIVVASTSILFPSCEKIGNFPGNYPALQIDDIVQVAGGGDRPDSKRTVTFHYNSFGKLDSLEFNGNWSTPLLSQYHLTYNSDHTLHSVEEYEALSPQYQSMIVTTFYYKDDRIYKSIDSGWSYDDYPMSPVKRSDSILYDAQDRIMAVYTTDSIPVWLPTAEEHYEYDTDGNLAHIYNGNGADVLAPVNYDNKTSFLRTDPFLMFITRNYSRNNPQLAYAYTNSGLPKGFTQNVNDHPLPFRLFGSGEGGQYISSITYE